ncbi:MAG: methylaspartate mutase accessory protein GlmL [Defluviitaleaceae bacterium]|nr:methylaspartate mutase accessory protein GlmL [Defluviitaleaceae bacterium]MCL2238913.1 methylaspartate mutase accessory protein GlmL [Defluviitaleaceae bacterium]
MNVILTVDFGSTFTKVAAVCAQSEKIIATAKAFTTIHTDIRHGLDAALAELYRQGGRMAFSQLLAASSAGGGLKMVAVGLVPALTAKAASMAACSAGAKVVKTFAYELSAAEQQEIHDIRPDLILLSGGTDGGNKAVILHNAKKLAEIEGDFSVIIAGNKSVAQAALETLVKGNKAAVICGNVMPAFNTLDIMPAKHAIRDLFMEKIIEAKGLTEASRMMSAPILPTPLAVFEGAELLAKSLGPLLAVDVGGATTDVYSITDGAPTLPGVVQKGLPEPYAKRSVEGDLGMRYSLDALAEAAAHIFPETEDFAHFRARCAADPAYVPQPDSPHARFDATLCAAAVDIATQRHSGRLETTYTPHGKTFYQLGKDLSQIKYVIGIGGAIIYSADPRAVLEKATCPSGGEILKPVSPAFLMDASYIFASAGLLSRVNEPLALKIMEAHITPPPPARP